MTISLRWMSILMVKYSETRSNYTENRFLLSLLKKPIDSLLIMNTPDLSTGFGPFPPANHSALDREQYPK